MYISIGSDCVTKTRIEELKYDGKKQESNLFDWVLSDLDTVNYILKQGPNSSIFDITNWEILTKTIDDKWAIKNKSCYFISLHDTSSNLTHNEAFHIVSDKYKRRLLRFFDRVTLEEELHFIGVFDKSNPIHTGNNILSSTSIAEFQQIIANLRTTKLPAKSTFVIDDLSQIQYIPDNANIIDSNTHYLKDWFRFFLDWKNMLSNI